MWWEVTYADGDVEDYTREELDAILVPDNKAHVRRHFPRGHVHVIEDYSENGEFIVKREHQSRYYQTHSYTLFGMVVGG